jgi:hypothetical protein
MISFDYVVNGLGLPIKKRESEFRVTERGELDLLESPGGGRLNIGWIRCFIVCRL